MAVVDSPADRGAQANACFYFLMDFGILIASSCFGKLMDASASVEAGYNQMFLISGIREPWDRSDDRRNAGGRPRSQTGSEYDEIDTES